MNIISIKSEKGFEDISFDENDFIKWFEDNTDEKGFVTEEVIIFEDVETKSVDDRIEFSLSDGKLDRDFQRIDPKGWDLKNFKDNPIILWSHNKLRPNIGIMEGIKVKDGVLTGKAKFVPKDIDEFAWSIGERVKQGFLTKGSVGFIPKQIEIVTDEKNPTRLIHRKQELLEYSIVNVPALPSSGAKAAVSETCKDNGEDINDLDNIFEEETHSSYVDFLFGSRKTSGLENLFKK